MTILNKPVASMEAINYVDWYRKRGVRTQLQLKNVLQLTEETFELPKLSLLHYISTNPVELGINDMNFLIRNNQGYKVTEHVTSLLPISSTLPKDALDKAEIIGQPIKTSTKPETLISEYRRYNKNIRPLVNLDTIERNNEAVIIVNYCLLKDLYRYRENFLTTYNRSMNIINTLVDKIIEFGNKSNRQQFINMTLPDTIPTRIQFNNIENTVDKTYLQPFNRLDSLMLLELWKLFGDEPSKSAFGRISKETLDKVNFLITDSGHYNVFNLGNLVSWIKTIENPQGIISSTQLRIYFLEYVNTLTVNRSLGKEDSVYGDELAKEELLGMKEAQEEQLAVQLDEDGEEVEFHDDGPILSDETLEKVALTTIGKLEEKSKTEYSKVNSLLLKQLIVDGKITEKQAVKATENLDNSMNIPDPYGSGKTIGELLEKYDESIDKLSFIETPDKKLVIDKSMLRSKLKNITSDYVEHKLKLDILASVMALQNDGYIVRNYRIEEVKDVHNEVEIHSIRVERIGGEATELKFKIPTIRKDGTYFLGGVKYYLRKGRRDVPIRKVKPWKVFLTSYKSKLPILKSQKQVDDYGSFIRKTIEQIANEPNSKITIIESTSTFNHLVKLPRAYNIFAKGLNVFKVGNIKFDFSYSNAISKYGEEVVKRNLANGEMIVAENKDGLIVIDDNGILRNPDTNKTYGTIMEVCGISEAKLLKAPVEKCVMDLVGVKNVPIAAVICHRFGLENLLASLKLTHRVVPKGTNLNLGIDEYAVKFANDTLVLKRDEYLGQLIVGSLNAYKDTIALFDLEEFSNNEEIWSDIFQKRGLPPKLYRELDSLYNSWIDPITLQRLKKLGEPTRFRPLVVKAVKLLTEDYHKKEMSGDGFVTVGYERIAGFIIKEFSDMTRKHKARGLNRRLDLHPNAIYNAIETDTSKQIVEDSNPIQAMKEMSNITFSGTGGQNSRVMVKNKREYDISDKGLISEGGVDNGDVGVTSFLSVDPKVSNLLGISSDEIPTGKEGAKIQSAAMFVSPFADRDDKRYLNNIKCPIYP